MQFRIFFISVTHTCTLYSLCVRCVCFSVVVSCTIDLFAFEYQTKMNVILRCCYCCCCCWFFSLYSVCRLLLANTATNEPSKLIQHTNTCTLYCPNTHASHTIYINLNVFDSDYEYDCVCVWYVLCMVLYWVQHTVTALWRVLVCALQWRWTGWTAVDHVTDFVCLGILVSGSILCYTMKWNILRIQQCATK